ncbi:MAG: ATP-binding protein [Thermodesulfobacteriota bacterium]
MKAERGPAGDIQPFQLVKFFSYTSLVVILACTLLLSWVISNRARDMLMERSEAYAHLFAENLSHQVFQQFVLPTVLRYGRIALSQPVQFERLDAIVRSITHGLKIEAVSIFDAQENIVSYSTLPELVGMRDLGGEHYRQALAGHTSSELVMEGDVSSRLPGQAPIRGRLLTYIPFRQEKELGENTGPVMGVIQIEQDLSEDLEAISSFQGRVIGASLVFMAVLFGVLRLIVARADRIIEERARVQRRLEEKLHDAERLAALGKMVAAVSHEIKNPLGIVRSTAEILGKRLAAVAPENNHLAGIIIDETSRLDGIVREFLDFARPQTPKIGPCAVNSLLEKALRLVAPECQRQGIGVETDLDPAASQVGADEQLLYRAVLNILVNAIQSMPEGGTLTVRTSRSRDQGVVVTVADTGVGIAPDKLEQIFQPFYTDKNKGTGLGLAIVRNILDAHGGRVEVDSVPGAGTVMRLVLP